MSRRHRSSYLGGHTIVRTPKPWWLPEEIPLDETGHLNPKSQAESDRTILRELMLIAHNIRRKQGSPKSSGRQIVGRADRLLIEKGADDAIDEAFRALMSALDKTPVGVRQEIIKFLQSRQSLVAHQEKRQRPGKRERAALRHARNSLKRVRRR